MKMEGGEGVMDGLSIESSKIHSQFVHVNVSGRLKSIESWNWKHRKFNFAHIDCNNQKSIANDFFT